MLMWCPENIWELCLQTVMSRFVTIWLIFLPWVFSSRAASQRGPKHNSAKLDPGNNNSRKWLQKQCARHGILNSSETNKQTNKQTNKHIKRIQTDGIMLGSSKFSLDHSFNVIIQHIAPNSPPSKSFKKNNTAWKSRRAACAWFLSALNFPRLKAATPVGPASVMAAGCMGQTVSGRSTVFVPGTWLLLAERKRDAPWLISGIIKITKDH